MNDSQTINSLEVLEEVLKTEIAVLIYFNTISCNVGESLEPKIKNLCNSNFPKLKFYTVDINFSPEVAAKCNAFVEPTIIVYFDGKETIRKSRNFGLHELESLINRPYQLIFE
jgi:thioredoxin-like negative regulator of GroEL